MKAEELKELPDQQLLDIAYEVNATIPAKATRKELIKILSTYPEPGANDLLGYLDNADVGDLVAFRTSDFKVKSAKIVKKSSGEGRLMLETKYGAQFLVDYDDIVWVNTTGRWPRWVFNLLKGNSD